MSEKDTLGCEGPAVGDVRMVKPTMTMPRLTYPGLERAHADPDVIKRACELLQEASTELKNGHMNPATGKIDEPEVLAIIGQHEAVIASLGAMLVPAEPIRMVLHCPKCGLQHVDAPDPLYQGGRAIEPGEDLSKLWTNPPHRSHLCHGCGTIWRPADVPTVGVESTKTQGQADTWKPRMWACPAGGGQSKTIYDHKLQPAPAVPVDQAHDDNAEYEKAAKDALMYGTGIQVDGKHVELERIRLHYPKARAVPADPWPKLNKPATVGAGTFGVGVSSRLVVEAAQRQHEYKAEQVAKTKEQMQADEASRRALWDMLHGAPAVPAYESAGFLLHWPAPGGGREILWSKDGEAGRAIGCPVEQVFKLAPKQEGG